MSQEPISRFSQLELAEPVLKAVDEVGYEAPSPIQIASIPALLANRDLVGQAQTGTGKTAAFALPLLSRIDLARDAPQILVLTPTRELAIQVAEAMQTYARHLPGFHVLPVYGGQSIDLQLSRLRRRVHVVVGTPGRILDHLRRKTLKLEGLRTVVLDEADEMLRMGFIGDVEEILEHTPVDKQVALFSATMPEPIRRVARRHLRDPVEVHIETRTTTVAATSQHYLQVSGFHKLDVLTRLLESEEFDAMLIFVRTRNATTQLAEKLEARGFSSGALSGEMSQAARERIVERFRRGALDILVATDVAARGLDVDRISHVLNYDLPYDTEAYVHRIGRTGRAGREGKAFIFVAPRERHMLRAIERATRQPIAPMQLPSAADVANRRVAQFKEKIQETLAKQELGFFAELVDQFQAEQQTGMGEIAAALAYLAQQDRPLMPHPSTVTSSPAKPSASAEKKPAATARPARPAATARPTITARAGVAAKAAPRAPAGPAATTAARPAVPAAAAAGTGPGAAVPAAAEARTGPGAAAAAPGPSRTRADKPLEPGFERYRIEVGRIHGVEPKNIVGAICNEAELDSEHVGAIRIEERYSMVDLPEGMPKPIFKHLRKTWVCGQKLQISLVPTASRPEPEKGRTTRPAGEFRAPATSARNGEKPPRPRPKPGDFGKKKPARKSAP